MKNNRGIVASIFLCGVLIFSGMFSLALTINNKDFKSFFPSKIDVNTVNNQGEFTDYMSLYMARDYVGIYDADKFSLLIKNGTFDGTYTTYTSYGETNYVFSKAKLDARMTQIIEEGLSFG